jgi:hypothetical protein
VLSSSLISSACWTSQSPSSLLRDGCGRTSIDGTRLYGFCTGPVGVGKSTVATELSELLGQTCQAHALIDLDWLRWCYPSPADDPFQLALGLQNLAAVWSRYQAAGAARLILVDVVETRATLASYQTAIPGAETLLVRLHADLPTLQGVSQVASGARAWPGTSSAPPSSRR